MNAPTTFAVLQGQHEIDTAEQDLLERSLVPGAPGLFERARDGALTALRRPPADRRPDPIKSWDVRRTVDAIEATLERDEPVLDMGSVGCAILPALHALGYTSLHGIDLDPQVRQMPHADVIDYRVGDLTQTPWDDGTFGAVTSISVIEHGVDDDALLREVARLLRPGGTFYFSTDYWPDKIDTSEIQLFDLPWRIFSAEEIDALVGVAARHGLEPVEDHREAVRAASGRPIHFAERDYTFLFGALVRRAG